MKKCEKSVTITGSNISHRKISKQHNRDEKMWTKFIQKIETLILKKSKMQKNYF